MVQNGDLVIYIVDGAISNDDKGPFSNVFWY